jgi:hypothetical protein
MHRALPGSEYYGDSAPPRTDRLTVSPAHLSTPDAWTSRQGPKRFPCSLWFARSRRSPTLPLRPRRAYAADLQRGLPVTGFTIPGSSPTTNTHSWQGTHRPRPTSTKFEPVDSVEGRYDIGSSRTPLDPARRTHTIWQYWRTPALSGLLPASPAPPGSACPQLLPGRCDDPATKVSHLHSNHSASRRTKRALNAFDITFDGRLSAGRK